MKDELAITRDLRDVLRYTLERLSPVVPATGAAISLLNQEGDFEAAVTTGSADSERGGSRDPPVRSRLGASLVVGGKVIGALQVETTQPHAYTFAHRHLLELAANHIAAAVDLARIAMDQRSALGAYHSLVRGAVHDLRNALTVAGGHAQLMRRQESVAHGAEEILAAVFRLEGIARRLDEFSREAERPQAALRSGSKIRHAS